MGGSVKAVTGGITGGIKGISHGVSHGNSDEILSGYKQYGKSAIRGGAGVATFGTSEIANKALGGRLFGRGDTSSPTSVGSSENPAQTLAQSGGAPLLANIAMGASVEDTLAGYFGHSDYNTFYGSLSPEDRDLVDGVKKQLTEIQTNTNLRNQAVQNVVNDFPNIAAQAAKVRQASGEEFDTVTKGYIDQALQGTAAKYAVGGQLSSGAMNEASAKVGAQYGMDKLNYMDNRGDNAYNQGVQGWQARYNETAALRNFQNLMTQGAAGNGFSAAQASLNRNQQTNLTNAGFANQQNMQNQQNDNALFGSIGGLAGTAVGSMVAGPPGGMAGYSVGRAAFSGAGTGGTNYNAGPTLNRGFSGNPRLNLGY